MFCEPCRLVIRRTPGPIDPLFFRTGFEGFRPYIPGTGPAHVCFQCRNWFRGRVRSTPFCSGACATLSARTTRARRIQTAGGRHTEEEWQARLSEYEGRCAYCPATATSKDHVVPLALGGSDEIANIVPACKSCNSSKHALPLADWLARRAVRQPATAAL
jgi:hypothetical protein